MQKIVNIQKKQPKAVLVFTENVRGYSVKNKYFGLIRRHTFVTLIIQGFTKRK